jgi:membrane protease YdiL (CAAX protease family)
MGLGRTPGALIVLLFTFIGMALGTFAATAWVHKRPIATLFGPRAAVIRDFALGAGLLFAVSLPVALLVLASVSVTPGVALSTWVLFLPLAVLGLLIQTGAEEILFRGYLQQQLAARFVSRWVWMVLPSVLFGLVHYAPTETGPNTWMLIAATGFFGLLLADLTARSGNIGIAWGLHFANNVMAMLIFTTGEALDALAVFRLPAAAEAGTVMAWIIALDIAGMVLVWWIARRLLRQR